MACLPSNPPKVDRVVAKSTTHLCIIHPKIPFVNRFWQKTTQKELFEQIKILFKKLFLYMTNYSFAVSII